MSKVSELIESHAEMTGTRPQEGTVRGRHLREAGLLPSTGRGRGGANISALHCANYHVGWLGAERAINTPEAVRQLNTFMPKSVSGDLKQLRPEAKNAFWRPDELDQDQLFFLPDNSFVEASALLIEWCRFPTGRQIVTSDIVAIGCCRNWPSAFIRFRTQNGGFVQQEYAAPPLPNAPHRIELHPWQTGAIARPASFFIDAWSTVDIIELLSNLLEKETKQDVTHLSNVRIWSPLSGRPTEGGGRTG